jgi:hypothetical protein
MGHQLMVATELTLNEVVASDASRQMSCVALSAAAVIGFTTLGIGLALVDPALAGSTRPHPAFTGSVGDAVAILQNNARVLATPFLLVLLGFPRSRLGRRAGDLILTALTAASTIPVGLELGRWQGRLLPYIPQLPLEWAALALALGAWLTTRADQASRRQLVVLAASITVLLVGAAAIETWCTPHRHPLSASNPTEVSAVREPHVLVGDGGCHRHGFCAGTGPVASRSPAPFPSPRSVPLGRNAGADRAHSNHRPPQGGITR